MTLRFLSVAFLQGLAETSMRNVIALKVRGAHSKILSSAEAGQVFCSVPVESHLAYKMLEGLRPTTNAKLRIVRTPQGPNEPDEHSILIDWSPTSNQVE